MNGITFAEPSSLYLLAIIPAMIVFYVLKQHKATASLRMPGLQPFAEAGTTFRHYLRHILFAFRTTCSYLSDYCSCPSTGVQIRFQNISTEGIDIVSDSGYFRQYAGTRFQTRQA